MTIPRFVQGSDLPDLTLTWTDTNGAVIDFSTGWTFTLQVGRAPDVAVLTVTTGITGTAIAPNITVAWAASGGLDSLAPGRWTGQLTAVRTADNKKRRMQFDFTVAPAVADARHRKRREPPGRGA
jgi:hypothetical protein